MSIYITNETAEKLTEAGYPGSDECPVELGCCVPTLSELIEACGDEFSNLAKTYKGWLAVEDIHVTPRTGEGKSPEEAVAKLWLDLNK